MKKIIVVLSFLFSVVSITSAQDNISTLFQTLPDNIILGLDAEQKGKLTSNISDTLVEVNNNPIYEKIKRLAISDDYISLKTSEAGTIQIKLLPLINESKIVCVIKTVCGRICDSQISFYTTKWTPIDKSTLLPTLDINQFIKVDADKNSQEYQNSITALDMIPLKMGMLPDNSDIIITQDIEGYLSEDDYKYIQPYLIEKPLALKWDKVSYKK